MNIDDKEQEVFYDNMVQKLAKGGADILQSLTSEKVHLWHMASALMGEAGECFDAVKKHVIYNKPLDLENIKEELGDILFYFKGLLIALNITESDIMHRNIIKLSKRYPGLNYSDASAQIRADKQEGK